MHRAAQDNAVYERSESSKRPENKERRRHGRVNCDGVHCSLGLIENLSASGAQIRARGRPPCQEGGTLPITVESIPTGPVPLEATVVRIERKGIFRFRICVEFPNASEECRKQLTRIAQTCRTSDYFW